MRDLFSNKIVNALVVATLLLIEGEEPQEAPECVYVGTGITVTQLDTDRTARASV